MTTSNEAMSARLAHIEVQLVQQTREITDLKVEMSVLKSELRDMKEAIKSLITRPEFTPVKMLAYGMAGTILSSALVALLSKVLIK